jgi:hypothetical protein
MESNAFFQVNKHPAKGGLLNMGKLLCQLGLNHGSVGPATILLAM